MKLVRHKDGTINLRASKKAFHKELLILIKQEKALHKKYTKPFTKAIKGVFKKFPKGTVIPMPALIALTCQALSATPKNYREMVKECERHVRLNKHGDGYLYIRPGLNGGIRLRKP